MSRENERSLLLHDCAVVHMPTAAAATATPPKKKREPTHFNKLSSDIIFNIAQFASDPTTPSGLFELMTLVRMGEDLKHLYYLSDAREYNLTREQLASGKIKRDEKGAPYFSGNSLYPGLTSFVRKQLFIRDSLRDQSPVLLKLLRDYPEWFHKEITLGNSIFSLVQQRLSIPAFSYTPQKTGEEVAKTNADFREMRLPLAYYLVELSYFFTNNPVRSSTSHKMEKICRFFKNYGVSLATLSVTIILVYLFLSLPRELWFMTASKYASSYETGDLSNFNGDCRCDTLASSACSPVIHNLETNATLLTQICDLYQSHYCPSGSLEHRGYNNPPWEWGIPAPYRKGVIPVVSCSSATQIGLLIGYVLSGSLTLFTFLYKITNPDHYPIEITLPVDERMSSSDLKKIMTADHVFKEYPLGLPPERNKFFVTPSSNGRMPTPTRSRSVAAGPASAAAVI